MQGGPELLTGHETFARRGKHSRCNYYPSIFFAPPLAICGRCSRHFTRAWREVGRHRVDCGPGCQILQKRRIAHRVRCHRAGGDLGLTAAAQLLHHPGRVVVSQHAVSMSRVGQCVDPGAAAEIQQCGAGRNMTHYQFLKRLAR
jgi:hypothetical protein